MGSPTSGIKVDVGLVQAEYSALVSSTNPVTAGVTNVFKIQAKDLFSNVVIDTDEMFDFEIMNLATKAITHSNINYQF